MFHRIIGLFHCDRDIEANEQSTPSVEICAAHTEEVNQNVNKRWFYRHIQRVCQDLDNYEDGQRQIKAKPFLTEWSSWFILLVQPQSL